MQNSVRQAHMPTSAATVTKGEERKEWWRGWRAGIKWVRDSGQREI